MSPRIDPRQIPPQAKPKQPPTTRPDARPPAAASPAPAGDTLRLSTPDRALEDLKAQLAAPLPPLPARAPRGNWPEEDLARRAALIQALQADEAVTRALASWKQMPQDLKLKLGERISAVQAAVYGFRAVPLRVEPGPYRGGFHPANGGEITIGPKSLVSAAEFLNTVVHEQTHAMQWEKGLAASRRQLDAADPYAAVATRWHDNFFDYAPPSAGYRAYREQPVEAHAFATGDAVAAAVMRERPPAKRA